MNWINVEDRLPPQDVYVLVAKWDNHPKTQMFFISIANRLGNEWFDDYNGEPICDKHSKVTHWMPLPDNPCIAALVKES